MTKIYIRVIAAPSMRRTTTNILNLLTKAGDEFIACHGGKDLFSTLRMQGDVPAIEIMQSKKRVEWKWFKYVSVPEMNHIATIICFIAFKDGIYPIDEFCLDEQFSIKNRHPSRQNADAVDSDDQDGSDNTSSDSEPNQDGGSESDQSEPVESTKFNTAREPIILLDSSQKLSVLLNGFSPIYDTDYQTEKPDADIADSPVSDDIGQEN